MFSSIMLSLWVALHQARPLPVQQVVRLTSDTNSGSGVYLDPTHVLTVAHLFNTDSTNVSVDGSMFPATLQAIDRKDDLAILDVQPNNTEPTLQFASPQVEEEVHAVGFPVTTGNLTTTYGQIGALNESVKMLTGMEALNGTWFQETEFSAPVEPGNSGGALFDSKGRLVGLVNAKWYGIQDVSYAVPVQTVEKFVEGALGWNLTSET